MAKTKTQPDQYPQLTQPYFIALADLIQDTKGHGERLLERSHTLPEEKRRQAVQNAADILRDARRADDIFRDPEIDFATRQREVHALVEQAEKTWRRSQPLLYERPYR